MIAKQEVRKDTMSAFAPQQYQMQGTGEIPSSQPSEEELDKLQEIHELINLMIRDIPVVPHATAPAYVIPTAATMPYAWLFHQLPWSRAPYAQS